MQTKKIIRCFRYLLLKDTDSASLQIIFVCHKECLILKEETRKLIFKIALDKNFFKHLDRSHKHFDMFQARDEKLKKQVGLYKFEANNYKHYSSKDSIKKH